MDVDECNATLCDGTTCPQNDCDTNASCTNTNGSFTCACSPGFSGNSTVGTTCLRCAAGKYKTEFSNSDCTHCGTFSPAGSITFSDCDAPAFRFLFDEDPPPAPGIVLIDSGSSSEAIDAKPTFQLESVDGLGDSKAFNWSGAALGLGAGHIDADADAFVRAYQGAWAASNASRNSFTLAYWIRAYALPSTSESRVVEFSDGSGRVYLYAWHSDTMTEMFVSDGSISCCPGNNGTVVQAPPLTIGEWVHVAFVFTSQKYPVRNENGMDATALEVAYGYGTHTISESAKWTDDLVAGNDLGGVQLFDEEYGDTLLEQVDRIDSSVLWNPDVYGGPWMCATSAWNGVYYPVRLLLGGQVECFSNSSLLCNVTDYQATREGCQATLASLPRDHVGFRTEPTVALGWTADFVGVMYMGYASEATYDSAGVHNSGLGPQAQVEIQHPFAFTLEQFTLYCYSWRNASCPGAFVLEGSNDGVSWNQLASESGYSAGSWDEGQLTITVSPAPTDAYANYRLAISQLAGGNIPAEGSENAFANIDELELYGGKNVTAYFNGADVTTSRDVDALFRLPGTGKPLNLKFGNFEQAASLDDLQIWFRALSEEELYYLQYEV